MTTAPNAFLDQVSVDLLSVDTNILPSSNATFNIGSPLLTWNDIQAQTMTVGTLTVTSEKAKSMTLTNTTNQLSMGAAAHLTTLNSVACAGASQVVSMPDSGKATANILLSEAAQTINGANTFTTAVAITPVTNQAVLGVTNTTTINSVAPASSRVYTLNDCGKAANFIMSEQATAQTINSGLNLTGTVNVSTLSGSGYAVISDISKNLASLAYGSTSVASTIVERGADKSVTCDLINLSANSNQILAGSGAAITTLTIPAPASSQTVTIPDAGASSSVMLTAGNQTAAGIQTFSNSTDASSSTVGGVIVSGGIACAKKIFTGSGISLPTAGGTAGLLTNSELATNTSMTFSGIWAANQTGTGDLSQIGNYVMMVLPFISANATVATSISLTVALPARFRPSMNFSKTIIVVDNGTATNGKISVTTAGNITIYASAAGGNFAGISAVGATGFGADYFVWHT